jgi:hypothetical protein
VETINNDEERKVSLDPRRSGGDQQPVGGGDPRLLDGAYSAPGCAGEVRQNLQGVKPVPDDQQGGRAGVPQGDEAIDRTRETPRGVRHRHLNLRDWWRRNCDRHPFLETASQAGGNLPAFCVSILLRACEKEISDEQAALVQAYLDAGPARPLPLGDAEVSGTVMSFHRSWRFPQIVQWRIRCEGYLAQGAVPRSVKDAVQVGDVVSLKAFVVAAEGRERFAWIKRPRDARITKLSGHTKENSNVANT